MEGFQGWRIDGQFDADIAVEIVIDVPGDDPPVIFELAPANGDWTEIEMFNARLIAAAPLMLGSLRFAMQGLAKLGNMPGDPPIEFDQALDLADSVTAMLGGRK